MSDESRVETAPQPQGERLTLRRTRTALVMRLCSALLLSASGLYLFFHAHRVVAGSFCLGAMVSAASLPAFWKQYRLVRSGAILIVQSKASSQPLRIHPAAAVVVMSLITLAVLALGGVTLYILPPLSRAIGIQAFLAGFNLLLWLLTGFLWYRIATERRTITVVEPIYEQREGVWPPAPQVPKIR